MRKPLLAILLSVCLSNCGSPQTATEQLLRRGLSGEPSSLDPAAATDNFSIQLVADLYEGLLTESPTGEPLPGVATSWIVSKDQTKYTFRLRSNALWSNGERVTAQSFVSAWRRVIDPANGFPLADDLRLVKGAPEVIAGSALPSTLRAFAPDDNTFVVELAKPVPYFLQLLTHSSTYPIYSNVSAKSHNSQTLVSNGAYVLSRWLPGTEIRLRRNTNYWNLTNIFFPTVQYQIVTDENAQLSRYLAGQLDLTDSVPANAMPDLLKTRARELVTVPMLATAYYGLNLASGPLANNLDLRLSLAMAIDRRRLVQVLAAGQLPAYGLLPPGIQNYTSQPFPWKDLSDVERISTARQAYRRAGYSPNNPLKLRVLYNSNPIIRRIAVLTSAMWKETLGVETELSEEEFKVFLETRHDKSRWDIARLGWVADFNDATNFLDTLRSHSTSNDESYSNAAFDALLDAATTADPQERRSELQAAERTMLADYPLIPLYYFVSKRLVKPNLNGVKPNPLDRLPSSNLSIGY